MAISQAGITETAVNSGSPNGELLFNSVGNNAITTIIVCNTHATDTIDLTIFAVPSGLTAYDNPETTIVSQLAIPAGETVSFDQERLVLSDGDTLQGIASTAWATGQGLAVTVSTLPV